MGIIANQINNFLYMGFELNNRCNYSAIHPKCPNNALAEPISLSALKVYETIDLFSFYTNMEYCGEIYFSIYNEPLLDPRFFLFLSYARKNLPKSSIILFSNGWGVDVNIIEEALEFGVNRIAISAYNSNELNRFNELKIKFNSVLDILYYPNGNNSLDDRINIYSDKGNYNGIPCYMPTIYYFLSCTGDIKLCQLDYLNKYSLGNVYNTSIQEILVSDKRLNICNELRGGNRTVIDICVACKHYANCCPPHVQQGKHTFN